MTDFTPGRFVLSDTDERGARDPIALTQQVAFMRKGFASLGHTPSLIVLVVADDERKDAVARITQALEPTRS